MLSPEQMDDAGELVATVYRQIESEMLDYLVRKMIEGDIAGQRSQTAILLLSQTQAIELQRIIAEHAGEIDAAIAEEIEAAIAESDRQDVARLERGLGVSLPAETLSMQTAATTAGIRDIIARDNVEMNAAARSGFFRWSTWAATQVNTGAMTAEHALHRAVRELSRKGLGITEVVYRDPETGQKTITNHIDVAVKRHIRTQIGQDAARLTELRMDEAGCEFVEVTSHCGARPSHQAWHGRVYHRNGAIDYKGVHYEDFYEATGYEGLRGPYTALGDRLMGVNCRHSFGPWIPGTPRAYDPDPEHPSGLGNEEVYDLTQKQRARERDIRATKRELAAARQMYDADPSVENQVEVAKLQAKLRRQQEGMRNFIKEANAKGKPGTTVLTRQPHREWAGDMPKAGSPNAPANRTLDKYLATPGAKRKLDAAGMSKAAARAKIVESLKSQGIDTRGFRWLTAKQQGGELDKAARGFAAGLRGASKPLSPTQQRDVIAQAEQIGIPRSAIAFLKDAGGTHYHPDFDTVFVGGNVLPDTSSTHNRDTMSVKAVLAHEYYGHRRYKDTKIEPGDWRDEFRASYRAALDTPNLTDEERRSLMVDAYSRASEAGASLKYTSDYRRIVYGY